jgi:hypothetical protein
VARNASGRWLPLLLGAAVLVYVVRLPTLLGSSWNPHLTVLPFAALVVLTGASVAGDPIALPVVALLASLVVQSHVGQQQGHRKCEHPCDFTF